MNNLFKSITVINGEVYAEYNRQLTVQDFTPIHETDVIVVDDESCKGKKLIKYATYRVNPIVRDELMNYCQQLCNVGKFSSNPKSWVDMLFEFEIRVERVVDFRGCRTKDNRTEKINKSINEVTAEHKHITESVLPSKVEKIADRLDSTVNWANQMFSSSIIKMLTSEDSYSENFNTEQIKTLEENYKKLNLAISVALEQRKKVTEQLAALKREIAFTILKSNEWKILDISNDNVSIPEPVAKDIQDAIEKAFVKLNPFFNIQ